MRLALLGFENELVDPWDENGRAGGGMSDDLRGGFGVESILDSYNEKVITLPGSALLVVTEVIHSIQGADTTGCFAVTQMTVNTIRAMSVVGIKRSVME